MVLIEDRKMILSQVVERFSVPYIIFVLLAL